MREHGFSRGECDGFSPAQLTWHLRRLRRQQTERDLRQLLLITAGGAGGKAAQKVWKALERELEPEARSRKPEGSESETPLSQEDFERMMTEED